MRIFVTGATGFVGSAVVQQLRAAGHEVVGLARSDANTASLAAAGAEVHRGSLQDLDSLRSGAAACDGVIHCAFTHDFSDWMGAIEADARAIETLGTVLEGSNRPLIVTSGTMALPPGRVGTENDEPQPEFPRKSEQTALAFAARGVRAAAVRLAPTVHGDGDHGFVPALIGIARQTGVSAYVGDGENRWPAVHRLDAAHLFRLAVEKAPAGSRLHGAAEDGVPFREIAASIARNLSVPLVSKRPEEAVAHFGFLGHFAGTDNPVSSALTRERLAWSPAQRGLLDDLERADYFAAQTV